MKRKPQLLFCLLPTRRFPGENHGQEQLVGSSARAPSVPKHPRKKSPLTGTDPSPPVTRLHPARPKSSGCFWLSSNSFWGFGEGEFKCVSILRGSQQQLNPSEDFLCPIHLSFGDFLSSHGSSGSSNPQILMEITVEQVLEASQLQCGGSPSPQSPQSSAGYP